LGNADGKDEVSMDRLKEDEERYRRRKEETE
jgi:hypothetical protein